MEGNNWGEAYKWGAITGGEVYRWGYNWRGLEVVELMSVRLRYLGFNFFKRLAGRAGPNRPTWWM